MNNRLKAIVSITAVIALAPLAVGGCQRPTADTPGRLALSSEPVDRAEVFINGRLRKEKTNALFELAPGAYQIKLVKTGAEASDDMEGQAVVEIKSGRTSRTLVRLSRLKVVPAAGRAAVQVESPSQKVILNYFTALAAGDTQKAFGYLSRQGQINEGGYRRYAGRWRPLDQLELIGLAPVADDSEPGAQASHVKLRLTLKALGADPEFNGEVEAVVAVVEEPPGLGLLKIDSIVDRTELPFPPQLRP